jgi:hypothetical protein
MNVKLLAFSRILLSLAGVFLAFAHPLFYCGEGKARKWVYTIALILCAAFAFYLYLGLGPQFHSTTPERIMNPHDFFHYYVGSKYHREVGYFNLYDCALIADWETRKSIKPKWVIRDLRTYGYRAAELIARQPQHCKAAFTDERWESFKYDVAYLSRLMVPNRWNLVLKDKGYNATPVWNRFASTLTNLIPMSSRPGLYGLLGLDYLYTIVLFVVVGVTFGWRQSLLVVLFWGVNFMSSPGFVKGSVSRLDWLACLVIAFCLLRRGRYAGAGALAGLATTLRVFPVLFFVGLACKGLWSLFRTRRIPREYLRFLVGFVVVVVLLVGLTSLTQLDRARWVDFTEKIQGHDKQIAGYRVGFKYAMLDPDIGNRAVLAERFESQKALWWTAQALVLVVVFFGARRLEDHHTMALSFVCVFFLTAPTFYYYQMLVIPFMLFLPDPRRRGLSLGMGAFFGWCVLGYTLRQMWPLGIRLSHQLSWTLVGLCAFMVVLVFVVFRGDPREESEQLPA